MIMTSFVELHHSYSDPVPVAVNPEWISFFEPYSEGTKIGLGIPQVDGGNDKVSSHTKVLYVKEDYETVKEMLHCR